MKDTAPAVSSARPTTCRMFESDFLEKFSRIHPITPFVVYIPLIGTLIYRTWARDTGFVTGAGMVLAGLFTWTGTSSTG